MNGLFKLFLLGGIALTMTAVGRAEEFVVGERAVVKTSTKIMGGQAALGTASAGTEFGVEKISAGGTWLLGSFTVNGQKVSGWVNGGDVTRAKARPATLPATPARPAVPDMRSMEEMYNRMILRYDRKNDYPATLYGFLPIRQGFTETITADVIARNRLSSGDYLFARFALDPSTIREPQTIAQLQSLPKDLDLNLVLEGVSKKALATGPADLIKPASTSEWVSAILESLSKDLFTDGYALAQAQHQQFASQFGNDHPETISALAWVQYFRRMNSGIDVESTHYYLLDWMKRTHGQGHFLTSRCWNNLAMIRHDRSDFEAARLLLLHALQLRAQSDGPMTADIPLMLINLARVLESEGRISDSLRCSKVSRSATRALPAPVRELVASSCFDEFADVRLVETGSPFYMRSGIPYRPSVVNFAAYGGASGRRDGNETRSSGFDSLSMIQIVGNGGPGTYPHTPFMLAAAHFSRQSDHASAERFERKAIELARKSFANQPDLHWHITMNMQALAQTQQLTGNQEAAIETLAEAIKIQRLLWEKEWKSAQTAFSSGRGDYFAFSAYAIHAPLLLLHAKCHGELKRLEDAERLYREALIVAEMPGTIDKRTLTRTTSHAPQCKVELAQVLQRLGKNDEAEKLYRSVLSDDFQRWCFSPWLAVRAPTALTGLAGILEGRGNPRESLAATQMIHDSYLLSSMGTGQARIAYTHPQRIDYAHSLRQGGMYAEATQLLQKSIASVESLRRQVGGDELNRARYFSELTRNAPHSLLAQMQVEVGDEFADHFGVGEFGPKAAFDTLEMGRGRALLDLMNRGGEDISSAALTYARNRNDQVLIQRVLKLREQERTAQNRVVQVVEQAAATNSPAEIARLQPEFQKAREAERQANRDLFDVAKEMLEKKAIEPMTAQQAAASLKPDEALLAYDVGAERSLILILWPDGKVDGQFLKWPDGQAVDEASLSAAVAEFFAEISREESPAGASPQNVHAPHELRTALLPDAIWERLRSVGRLYVVADGPLHRVPFEALFIDESGDRILVDQMPPMVYGPSATMLLHQRDIQNQTAAANRLELVALGDPQFQRDDAPRTGTIGVSAPLAARTRSLDQFGQLSPLPGTRAEIEVIRQTLMAATNGAEVRMKVLTGAEATVANLFQETNQPRFLHLATHGLAEGGRKAFDSALAMAAPSQVTSEDVGFLRLSDLMAQWGGKLNGTELVVLSACRTARGEMEAGDGFVALTWGFLFAGSESVMASLWEVDDTATALLMSRLYENLLGSFTEQRDVAGKTFSAHKPLPRSLALLEAKQWLRDLSKKEADELVGRLLSANTSVPKSDRPYSDPYYWAAFVLIGESHPTR